jgi:hypothetical protein
MYALPTISKFNVLHIPVGGKNLFYYRKWTWLNRNNHRELPLKQLYRSHDHLVWRYDRLLYFKIYFNCNDVEKIIKLLLYNWPYLKHDFNIPKRYKVDAWKAHGNKGAPRLIQNYYYNWSDLTNNIIIIAIENKKYVSLILNTIYNEFTINKKKPYLNRGDLYKHQGTINFNNVFNPNDYNNMRATQDEIDKINKKRFYYNMYNDHYWKRSYQQSLILKIMAQLPIPYWSIYTYMIDDIDVRRYMITGSSQHFASTTHDGSYWRATPVHYWKSSQQTIEKDPKMKWSLWPKQLNWSRSFKPWRIFRTIQK